MLQSLKNVYLYFLLFSDEVITRLEEEIRQPMTIGQNKDKGGTYQHDLFKGTFSGDKTALAIKYVTSRKSRASLDAQYGRSFMLFIVVEAKQELAREEKRNRKKKIVSNNVKGTAAAKQFKNADTEDMTRRAKMKPCPTCKTPIEKSGGCKHMSCMWCNTRFCWQCLSLVSQTDCNCKLFA